MRPCSSGARNLGAVTSMATTDPTRKMPGLSGGPMHTKKPRLTANLNARKAMPRSDFRQTLTSRPWASTKTGWLGPGFEEVGNADVSAPDTSAVCIAPQY
jgi:hypothetical protein